MPAFVCKKCTRMSNSEHGNDFVFLRVYRTIYGDPKCVIFIPECPYCKAVACVGCEGVNACGSIYCSASNCAHCNCPRKVKRICKYKDHEGVIHNIKCVRERCIGCMKAVRHG
jgi:hypothetical protein